MVKKALQIHTDDFHACESNLVKYKSLNSATISEFYFLFFFTKCTYLKFILHSTSPLSPPPKTRLPKSTINSQISILLHFKMGTCLHLNMAM